MDQTEIHTLLSDTFPDPGEAILVDDLRRDGDLVYSLVCFQHSKTIGYVGFSKMTGPFPCIGLGPVGVALSCRRNGVAAALIEEGLRMANTDGWQGVFVLGNPDYYGRFGFKAGLAEGFQSPYTGSNLMAVSLGGEDFPTRSGCIEYASAFAQLD